MGGMPSNSQTLSPRENLEESSYFQVDKGTKLSWEIVTHDGEWIRIVRSSRTVENLEESSRTDERHDLDD